MAGISEQAVVLEGTWESYRCRLVLKPIRKHEGGILAAIILGIRFQPRDVFADR